MLDEGHFYANMFIKHKQKHKTLLIQKRSINQLILSRTIHNYIRSLNIDLDSILVYFLKYNLMQWSDIPNNPPVSSIDFKSCST
jgi:hypothetical protein